MNNFWEDSKPEFKWPIVVSQSIMAPAEKVWQVISMPGNLEPCHPFCDQNPVKEWPGKDSLDEIHYLSGWIYERRFCNWIDGIGYDLEIGRVGGNQSHVSWRIKPEDSHSCNLIITVYPHLLQNIPSMIRWFPHTFYLHPQLRKYLKSVTKGFEWYIIHGKAVPRNHFGEHAWFSAR